MMKFFITSSALMCSLFSAMSLNRSIEKIVNGTDVEFGEIPYIVSLRNRSSFEHYCGASILNQNYVLTAAHCVFGYSAEVYDVQYGSVKITSDSNNVVPVEEIHLHPEYTPGRGYKNDIAVLKLKYSIPYGINVQPVKLPPPFQNTPAGANALLSGWGITHSEGNIMDVLQKVNITIYSDDECERLHQSTGPTKREVHICAGVPEGGKGQCSGDSGGPLVVQGRQVGIVSWSIKPCAVRGYPGVFAKVSSYVEWIKKQMRQ